MEPDVRHPGYVTVSPSAIVPFQSLKHDGHEGTKDTTDWLYVVLRAPRSFVAVVSYARALP